MSNKRADYGISAVKYNSEHTHINRVRINLDKDDKFEGYTEHSREEIVNAINKGISFVSIIKNIDGKYIKGQHVFIVTINGQNYIKTIPNDYSVDNLGDLPEFQ